MDFTIVSFYLFIIFLFINIYNKKDFSMRQNIFSRAILATFFLSSIAVNAQVTIGDDSLPAATLDVVATSVEDDTAEGIIAPRLTGDALQDKVDMYGADQDGAFVYVTSVPTAAAAGKTENVKAKGYYYYDATAANTLPGTGLWIAAKSEASASSGAAIIPFASGLPVALVSADLLNGALNAGATTLDVGQAVGFGSSSSIDAGVLGGAVDLDLDDVLNLDALQANLSVLNNAFIMPRSGNITSIHTSFTSTLSLELSTAGLTTQLTAGISGALGEIPIIGDAAAGTVDALVAPIVNTALTTLLGEIEEPALEGLNVMLYGETAPESNEFAVLQTLDLKASGESIAEIALGTTLREKSTSVIPVTAGSRYFLALQAELTRGNMDGGLIERLTELITVPLGTAVNGLIDTLPGGFLLPDVDIEDYVDISQLLSVNDLINGLVGASVYAGTVSGGISVQ
jgi:hypothetical protein